MPNLPDKIESIHETARSLLTQRGMNQRTYASVLDALDSAAAFIADDRLPEALAEITWARHQVESRRPRQPR
jgi:hypothetical protein